MICASLGALVLRGEEARREVVHEDHLVVRDDEGSLEHVLQLPHVAGPGVAGDQGHGPLVDLDGGRLGGLSQLPQEGLDQQEEVTRAVPEGGDLELQDGDPVVEVLAKLPLVHHL